MFIREEQAFWISIGVSCVMGLIIGISSSSIRSVILLLDLALVLLLLSTQILFLSVFSVSIPMWFSMWQLVQSLSSLVSLP